jgi:hypothetical protein
MDVVLGAALMLAAVAAVFYYARQNAKKRAIEVAAAQRQQIEESNRAQQALAEIEACGGDINKLPDLTSQVTGLILKPGERCFAIVRGARHVAEGHRTKYVGRSQGISVRITKGVRYHVGGYAGRPITTTFEAVKDTGDLYVTTQRVVFSGSKEVTSVMGGKIADVRIDGDHIWLIAENRKTPLGLKLSPATAPVIAYASRMLAESSQRAGRNI